MSASPAKLSIQPVLRVYYDTASGQGSAATTSYTEGLSYFRVGTRGGYGPDLTYMLQFEARDFVRDRGNLTLRYCVLQWQATPSATLELGQTDEPFGLESYTQVRNLTFLERGLPFAFAPFYHTGVSWRQRVGAFAWHAGVFGNTLGAGPGDDGPAAASASRMIPRSPVSLPATSGVPSRAANTPRTPSASAAALNRNFPLCA